MSFAQHHTMFDEVSFTTYDYVIGGKLVVGHATYDDHYSQLLISDEDARQKIKFELALQLATYMVDNKLVEFTQQQNPMDMSMRVAIRAYVAPNDQVRILRLANKIV